MQCVNTARELTSPDHPTRCHDGCFIQPRLNQKGNRKTNGGFPHPFFLAAPVGAEAKNDFLQITGRCVDAQAFDIDRATLKDAFPVEFGLLSNGRMVERFETKDGWFIAVRGEGKVCVILHGPEWAEVGEGT